jgi:hypothetical protein
MEPHMQNTLPSKGQAQGRWMTGITAAQTTCSPVHRVCRWVGVLLAIGDKRTRRTAWAAFFCREVDLEMGPVGSRGFTPSHLPVFLCFACIGTPSHLLVFCVLYAGPREYV